MTNKTKPTPDRIVAWLQEQHAGYDQLLKKMETQKKAVDQKDETLILHTLHEKEHILGHLHSLNFKIQQGAEMLSDAEHEGIIQTTQKLRGEIESLLMKILTLETYCEHSLNREKSDIKGQMQSLKHGKTILKGYGSSFLKRSNFSKNV